MSKVLPSSATLEIFSGHLGNLTTDQESQLEIFKAHLANSKLYTPVITTEEDGLKKASHDDPTLLYFYFISFILVIGKSFFFFFGFEQALPPSKKLGCGCCSGTIHGT